MVFMCAKIDYHKFKNHPYQVYSITRFISLFFFYTISYRERFYVESIKGAWNVIRSHAELMLKQIREGFVNKPANFEEF